MPEHAHQASAAHCRRRRSFAEIRQRLRVLESAVGANTVMLIGLVLKLIVFG